MPARGNVTPAVEGSLLQELDSLEDVGFCDYGIVFVGVGVANSGARGIMDITAGVIKSRGFIVTAHLEQRIGIPSDDRYASRPEAGCLTFWVCCLSAMNPAGVSAAGVSGGAFCFLVGV